MFSHLLDDILRQGLLHGPRHRLPADHEHPAQVDATGREGRRIGLIRR